MAARSIPHARRDGAPEQRRTVMTSRLRLGVTWLLALLVGTTGVVAATAGSASAAVSAHGDAHHHDENGDGDTSNKGDQSKKDKKKDDDAAATSSSDDTTYETHGMIVHDSTGGREPTEEDHENAEALYDAVVEGIAEYEDLEAALADGYVETRNSEGLTVKHFMKRGGDGGELDPNEPSGLVYFVDDDQTTLLGAVWVTRENEPPQPGGPLTRWHDHSPLGCPESTPDCPIGTATDGVPPLMFHVWTFDGAANVFAHGIPDAVGGDGGAVGDGERPRLPFDV
jgi:hypothetical protein